MEVHKRFLHPELRETIFGYAPEYSDKYDLALFLRRIVILSATLMRAYYKAKHTEAQNMTSRVVEKIVERPFLSIDNCVSILTAFQSAGEDLEPLGMSALKILSDESSPDYIDLYEVKAVLQDDAGKFFQTSTCRVMIEKVISCVNFITETEIEHEGESVRLAFRGEVFDISDLFKYEFCYLYRTLQDVDPVKTAFVPL